MNILVPTDFSEESINALKLAVHIARPLNAEITLLHVVDTLADEDVEVLDTTPHRTVLEESEEEFVVRQEQDFNTRLTEHIREKMQHLVRVHPGAVIRELIIFDSVHRHIAGLSADDSTSLIVMGSKGTNETRGFLIGSNTEKVIRMAKCPVLAVKQKVDEVAFSHICFASDFRSAPASAINWLKKLQTLFHSTLHLVKIITPGNFEISSMSYQRIRTFAETHELNNYTINIYNHYTEYEGILAFAKHAHVDLISLATHGNTGLMHMLMGSIAEDVANHSELPVMTFNQYS